MHPAAVLKGYRGVIQSDGGAGLAALGRPQRARSAGSRATQRKRDRGTSCRRSRTSSPHGAGPTPRPTKRSEQIRRYLARSGLGKTGSCHVFRQTMATLLLDGSADVRYVQAILGQASLAMTARYIHVAITELKAVHARTHPAERDHAPPHGGPSRGTARVPA